MDLRIALDYIQSGKPTQNAYAESFNGKFRDVCLNAGWLRNLWEARRRIAEWREEYNSFRPHSSLGNMTPREFVAALTAAEKAVLQI